MEDQKFDEIRQFCQEKGLTVVRIDKKQQSNGGNRTKNEYYVAFTCVCNREGRKKYKDLRLNPICKLCMIAANPKIADDVIKTQVEKNGHEFVKIERERKTKTRINVTFICKCVKDTTREHTVQKWEIVSSGSTCQVCAYIKRGETSKETYADRGDEIHAQRRDTMVARYGVDHPSHSEEFMQKRRDTNIERYGYEYACQHPGVIAKIETTMTEKYGARHYMQNTEMREKYQHNGFKIKQYTFPSGRVVDCQGYEPLAYDILLQEFQEDDILVESDIAKKEEIPKFWYEHEGKTHRYYPDICIWSQKKIIEVKSEWTAGIKPEVLELKRLSVLAKGFAYEMWILDRRGDVISRTQ